MQLQRLNLALHSLPLASETIVRRGVRKLYYVTSGRNAWWSTWILRYRDGCMHTDLTGAKQYAEGLRTNGSVFYIHELPVLVVEGPTQSLLVTQINCSNVLSEYRPLGSDRTRHGTAVMRRRIAPGVPLALAITSFDLASPYWDVAPPPSDSVLLFVAPVRLRDMAKYQESHVVKYQSVSIGANYPLRWPESRYEVKSSSLRRVVRARHRNKTAGRDTS